ncbi:ATP-grasp domain-containing protein [Eubacterium multiforme]|uniref:D-alanine-D-alanine ligase n=1 Tax=Eubacterium multiforme TaxID=83339 RepID=A0ABT9UTL2_9FIRM|nr:ATP-grasp domain-containing protein [Eubacterium multiforme]MDQ0149661.1 D-alanine-D-alanine ligase [Eubacterium multiforme]
MKIEVIATEVSNFNETGFGSIESCFNVYKAIKKVYSKTIFNIVKTKNDLEKIVNRKPELVIFGFKYIIDGNKKIWMSDYFEKNNINFIGTNMKNLYYDSNKIKAKDKLIMNSINTPKYKIVNPEVEKTEIEELKFPLFVKPIDAACSFGIDNKSLVKNFNELKTKVSDIYMKFNQQSLVEEFLPGREFTVAIIGNGDDLRVMPIELSSSINDKKNKFLTRSIKVSDIENKERISNINIKKEVVKLARKSFNILKARDFARIDIKFDSNNNASFIEINMVPGMTKGRSYFPIACEKNCGMSYDETVLAILNAGIKRLS